MSRWREEDVQSPCGRKKAVALRGWKRASKTGGLSMRGGQSRVRLDGWQGLMGPGAVGATEGAFQASW